MKHKFTSLLLCSALLLSPVTMIPVLADEVSDTDTGTGSDTDQMQFSREIETNADGVADFNTGGSASITVQGTQNISMKGRYFAVYQLFNAENSADGASIAYSWNEACKASIQQAVAERLTSEQGTQVDADSITLEKAVNYLNSLKSTDLTYPDSVTAEQPLQPDTSKFRYFIEDLRDVLQQNQVKPVRVSTGEGVSADNSITLSALEFGYYLIDEITTYGLPVGTAASLNLVTTANPDSSMTIKAAAPTIIKQVGEDDPVEGKEKESSSSVLPGDRTVIWNDVADASIGQTIPFRFLTAAPNMNGYKSYQFIVHDKMNPALTFVPDSVVIEITGKENGADKTVKLTADQFQVITDPAQLEEGETFQIRISDLKGLIDSLFSNKNADGTYSYGQTIKYSFNAVLNDLAADDIGRPGYENTVKLEFSCNPDGNGDKDTNDTPWDTVVVFTFELDNLKVNSDQAPLEGAKFRLYSDEACTNEVYVKAGKDGSYIVINRDSVGGDDLTGGEAPADAVEMESDGSGVFKVLGLDQGTYWLKETQAPAGYVPLDAPIKITITPVYDSENRDDYTAGDGATDKTLKELKATAELSGTTQDLETDTETGSANLKIVNLVGTVLPSTGSWWTWPLLIGGGALIGGGILYDRKKKARR